MLFLFDKQYYLQFNIGELIMNHQIVLFYLITAFGIASAVVYLLSNLIQRNNEECIPLQRHAMGIFTIFAVFLSVIYFVEELTLNESINTVFNYKNIIFIVIFAFYLWQTIVYLMSLVSDWNGEAFFTLRHQVGILTVIAAALSLYFLYTQVPNF